MGVRLKTLAIILTLREVDGICSAPVLVAVPLQCLCGRSSGAPFEETPSNFLQPNPSSSNVHATV